MSQSSDNIGKDISVAKINLEKSLLQDEQNFAKQSSNDSQDHSKNLNFTQDEVDIDLSNSRINKTSTDDPTIKNQLEILNGVSQRLISESSLKTTKESSKTNQKNAAANSNKAFINKYTPSFFGVMRLVLVLILDFDTLFLVTLLVSKIIQSPDDQSEYALPILLLFFQVFVRLLIEYVVDRRKQHIACQFNFSFIKKYFKPQFSSSTMPKKDKPTRKEGTFAFDLWQNLEIGDIVIMKKGYEFPADVLIIDSEILQHSDKKTNNFSGEKTTQNAFVHKMKEQILVNYSTSSQYKLRTKSCFSGTYERNRYQGQIKVPSLSVVQSLSGNLIWEFNKNGFFIGQFRFSDNSESFDISHDNIILRGSYLKSNHKLICIVLNVGSSCASSLQKKPQFKCSCKYIFKQMLKFVWTKKNQSCSVFMMRFRLISLAMLALYVVLELIKGRITRIQNFEKIVLNLALSENILGEYRSGAFNTFITPLKQFDGIMLTLPLFFQLTFEIIVIMQAYFLEWDINLIPANAKFSNLKSMSKLPWIGHLVTSPATLEGRKLEKVTYFKFGEMSFHSVGRSEVDFDSFEKREKAEKTKEKEEQHSDDFQSSQDEEYINFDYFPQKKNHQDYLFECQELDQIWYGQQSLIRSHLCDFLKSLSLLHQANKKPQNELQMLNENGCLFNSIFPDEEAQLMFATQFNCTFVKRKGQIITIFVDGKLERYEELIYQQVQLQSSRNKVTVQVLRPFINRGNIILNMKGSIGEVIDFVSHQNVIIKHHLNSESERLQNLGFTLQAFCKKELNFEESQSLITRIDQLSLFSKTFILQFTKICTDYFVNMTLIGLLGLQKIVPLRNALTIQDSIDNGVKVWLLSQFNQSQTITDCVNLNLLSNSQQIQIQGKNEREVEEVLNDAFNVVFETDSKFKLDQLKNRFNQENRLKILKTETNTDQVNLNLKEKIKRFYFNHTQKVSRQNQKKCTDIIQIKPTRALIFNGDSLLVILRNENLIRIFITLAMYCDLMVGSGIRPDLKGRLSKEIIRFQNFGRDINKSYVLCVIGSPEDRYLIEKQASDISIVLMNSQNSKSIEIQADITIDHFYGLSYMLFKHGSQLHRKLTVAARFYVKRSIFFSMILISTYFLTGWSFQLEFGFVHLVVYFTLIFQGLVVSSSVLYDCNSFNSLHRVIGQYKCNYTFQVFGWHNLPTLTLEILFDILAILFFVDYFDIFSHTILPANGFLPAQQARQLFCAFLLTMHTASLFIKFPVINKANFLLILLSIIVNLLMTLAQDSDLIGLTYIAECPHYTLTLFFILTIFALKTFAHYLIRQYVRNTSKWDQFNYYVQERIHFEQFESIERFNNISLDNIRHSTNVIDATELQYQRVTNLINKNLLCLTYRSELMDLIFEQIRYMKNLNYRQILEDKQKDLTQQGLGNAHLLILKACKTQINYKTLTYKLTYLDEDFRKNYQLNLNTDIQLVRELVFQIGWLILMFTILTAVKISTDFNKGLIIHDYIYYIVNLVSLIIAILLIQTNWFIKRDKVMLILTLVVNIFTITQIQIDKSSTSNQNENHSVVACVVAFSLLNRPNYTPAIVLICLGTTAWYINLQISLTQKDGWIAINTIKLSQKLSQQLDKNKKMIQEQIGIDTYLNILGIPIFTLICLVYVYWEEVHKKVSFLVMDRRIKMYKKLSNGVSKLVPEIIRKQFIKKDHVISMDKGVVVTLIKISNYKALVCGGQSEKTVVNLMQSIYTGLDKLILKHALFRLNAVEDTIEIVGGIKQYEQTLSQKILLTSAVHRSCCFAFDMMELAQQLSKNQRIPLQLQIGIHCATSVASGIIGYIRPILNLVGSSLDKTQMVVNQTLPMQICVSQQCFETLTQQNINLNIKLKERVKFGNSYENIYELLDKKNKGSKIKNGKIRKRSDFLGDNKKNGGTENHNNSDVDSSADLDLGDSELSGQIYQGSSQGLELDGSQFLKTDYQQQFQSIKEFKDDQEIACNPVLNQGYNLVNRNKWLFNFGKDSVGEKKFIWQNYYEHLVPNMIFLFVLLCLLYVQIFIFTEIKLTQTIDLFQLLWLLPLSLAIFIIYQMPKLAEKNMARLKYIYFITVIAFTALIVSSVVLENSLFTYNALTQLVLIMLLLMFTQRGQLFKNFLLSLLLLLLAWISITIALLYNTQQYFVIVTHSVGLLSLSAILVIQHSSREMQKRIEFNRHLMLTVEAKKNSDIAARLMPIQALNAIQKDESFIEIIKDASLLSFSLVGFQDFANSKDVENKPQLAFSLLNSLYCKFDELVEHYGLFKLSADSTRYNVITDPSVMIGAEDEAVVIQQALKLTLLGNDMIKAVIEARQHTMASTTEISNTQYLMRIGSQIAIHTGPILSCITGTKILEFQLFGKMPITCYFAKQNAPHDQLCITKETYNLLQKQPQTTNKLEFKEQQSVIREGTRGIWQTYIVTVSEKNISDLTQSEGSQLSEIYSDTNSEDSESRSDESKSGSGLNVSVVQSSES